MEELEPDHQVIWEPLKVKERTMKKIITKLNAGLHGGDSLWGQMDQLETIIQKIILTML